MGVSGRQYCCTLKGFPSVSTDLRTSAQNLTIQRMEFGYTRTLYMRQAGAIPYLRCVNSWRYVTPAQQLRDISDPQNRMCICCRP